MEQERRQVIREKVALPLSWQLIPAAASMDDVLVALLGHQAADLLLALQPLQSELTHICGGLHEPARPGQEKNRVANYRAAVQDREYSRALNLLNTKLDLLVQHAVYPTPPQRYELCLSAQGCAVDLAADAPLTDQRVALHLQLSARQHVICTGIVQAGESASQRVVFDAFHADGERVLSRYLLLKRKG